MYDSCLMSGSVLVEGRSGFEQQYRSECQETDIRFLSACQRVMNASVWKIVPHYFHFARPAVICADGAGSDPTGKRCGGMLPRY